MKNKELRISESGEKLVGRRWKVLDKGFVELVSYHGTDQLVEAAARVSYQKGTRSVSDTRNLIRYLWRHKHSSPGEMPCVVFQVKAPLFVIQQLIRHRTAKLNQESHRYSTISGDMMETKPDEWRLQSDSNKQGSEGTAEKELGLRLSSEECGIQQMLMNVYQNRIDSGIAREQARKDIPHSTYSQLYWQMDLRNLLHFLSLRFDSHAQKEIRDYAHLMCCVVKELFPIVFEAWIDYDKFAVSFSRMERELLWTRFLNYDDLENKAKKLGMSKREIAEFEEKLNRQNPPDFSLADFEEINDGV